MADRYRERQADRRKDKEKERARIRKIQKRVSLIYLQ